MKGKISAMVSALMLLSCCSGSAWANGGDTNDRNEFLELDIVALMKVTVTTASKREQTLADVPAAIRVITQDDIRRSGVRNIPDALAMAPGIQVAKVSNSAWSVSSRGFPGYTSNKLLILLDGRSIYSPSFSGTIWDSQSVMLEDVDRIEVIRGSGGTLWGANAVNGIINIITKSAKDTQGGLARVGLGEEGMMTGAVRYGGKLGETTFGRMYLNYLEEPQKYRQRMAAQWQTPVETSAPPYLLDLGGQGCAHPDRTGEIGTGSDPDLSCRRWQWQCPVRGHVACRQPRFSV